MKYRREIDGLRALAIIPIILYHAGIKIFGGGYVGVDIFFVVSGYLITSIILTDLENNNFSIKKFYERRARRILPALYIVLLSSAILAWFLFLPDAMVLFSKSLVLLSNVCSLYDVYFI
jgi:peptidoglycan/LPS O-acetylase OafA/YrhL